MPSRIGKRAERNCLLESSVGSVLVDGAESTSDPIPLSANAARPYGIIYALVLDLGRQP
ncbi:hypothetical protein [Acrocarpospora sp. B8E8]|uniref:hypothetical protein n=1 Tax=Acrocarpospora sp. B8E8 TaxID=3153572 RepID=UPI00325DDD98